MMIKISEMSRFDLEEKLREVLKENQELKVMLGNNNAAMKQQFNTLRTWQEQIELIHKEHKQKFDATKDLVLKLKQENSELNNKNKTLEVNLNKSTPSASANNSQDKSNSASQNIIRMLKYFSSPKCDQLPEVAAHISVEEAKSAMQFERERSMRICLEQTVEELKGEMEKMKLAIQNRTEPNTNPDLSALLGEATPRSISPSMSWDSSDVLYESNGCTMVSSPNHSPMKRVSENTSDNVLTMISAQEVRAYHDDQNRITHLTELLIEEKKKVSQLQRKLESKIVTKDQSTCSSLEEHTQQLLRKLKISEENFNSANKYLQKYKERCDSLENWLSVFQGKLESLRTRDNHTIEQLRSELENMRIILTNEQQAKLGEQKNFLDTKLQLDKVLKDYEDLMKTLENYQRDQENKDRQQEAWSAIQQRQMQEKLDRLTAKLVTSEEARSHMNQDLSTLKDQCERNQREIESIPILKSQVDLYKEELNKEKDSKQNFLQSIKKLQNETHILKTQNLQLLEQIQVYSESQTATFKRENNNTSPCRKTVANIYQASENTNGNSESEAGAQMASYLPSEIRESVSSVKLSNGLETNCNFYYCPKCNIAYSNYGHLLKHVDACLNTSD